MSFVLSPCVSSIPSVTGSLSWTGSCFKYQPGRMKVTSLCVPSNWFRTAVGAATPKDCPQILDNVIVWLVNNDPQSDSWTEDSWGTFPHLPLLLLWSKWKQWHAIQNWLPDKSQRIATQQPFLNRPPTDDLVTECPSLPSWSLPTQILWAWSVHGMFFGRGMSTLIEFHSHDNRCYRGRLQQTLWDGFAYYINPKLFDWIIKWWGI